MTTVLLTGATGFIGGATLAHGLSHDSDGRCICLVRGKGEPQARTRLVENLTRFIGADAARAAIQRVEIVVGDITDPASLEDRRLDAVTHLLHLAADTSFRAQEHCQLVNVEGTRALAARARRMPHLHRFLYSGTAMICGRNPPPVVQESDAPADATQHLVPYTRTKVAAEAMLRYSRFDDGDWKTLRARFQAVFGLNRPIEVAMLRAMRAYYQFSTLGVVFANERLTEPPPNRWTPLLSSRGERRGGHDDETALLHGRVQAGSRGP
ncbi:SDR family oxidoreductase, partial [Azospirillum argentinense]